MTHLGDLEVKVISLECVDRSSGYFTWSEVLCCTITIHLGDLEVKVMDLEILCQRILCQSFWLKSISFEYVDGSS